MIYIKHRTTMGNVCFVVFLAFLLVQVSMLAGPGRAHAAQQVQVSTQGAVTVDGQKVTLPTIYLEPLTEPYLSTAYITVHLFNQATGQYLALTPLQEVINVVYRVYEQVYRGVLQAVYAIVPSNVAVPPIIQLVSPVTISRIVYQAVYLSVYLRPPEPVQPPPVDPGTPPPVVIISDGRVTVGVTTGTATIDPATGTATGRPFFDRFLTLALNPANPPILVGDLTSVEAVEHRFETLLTMMALANNQTTSYLGNVNATFPAGTVDFARLSQQHPGAALVFSAKKITGDQAAGIMAEVLGKDAPWVPASPVYEIHLYVTRGGVVLELIPRFDGEATFGFPYNPGADPDALALYQVLADGTLVFHYNQTVDPATGQILLRNAGTSRYVVLENTKEFTDVPRAHWAYREVKQMVTRGVVRGMTETTFEPSTTVTRAQFVTLLQRALGIPEYQPATSTFSDVRPGDWFYGSVEAAVKAGLAQGMGDGTFAPNAKVTREQMATFMARAMQLAGKPVTVTSAEMQTLLATFVDADGISDWAVQNAAIAVKSGIIRGLPGNVFAPAADGNRAQAVTMIKRLLVHLGLVVE